MTLTRAETCSLWRGALLGLDILKSKAERDSPLGSQPLMLYPWLVRSEADRPQRWTLDEPLQLVPLNSLILEKETGPARGFGFLKILHPVVNRAELSPNYSSSEHVLLPASHPTEAVVFHSALPSCPKLGK